jgi:hypothetical protein
VNAVLAVVSCLYCGGGLRTVTVGRIIAHREGRVVVQCSECNNEFLYQARLDPVREVDLASRQRRAVAVCGSDGGYYRHLRLGQETCQACRDAHAAKDRERVARRGLVSA